MHIDQDFGVQRWGLWTVWLSINSVFLEALTKGQVKPQHSVVVFPSRSVIISWAFSFYSLKIIKWTLVIWSFFSISPALIFLSSLSEINKTGLLCTFKIQDVRNALIQVSPNFLRAWAPLDFLQRMVGASTKWLPHEAQPTSKCQGARLCITLIVTPHNLKQQFCLSGYPLVYTPFC